MLGNIKAIINRLFGKRTVNTDKELAEARKSATVYKSISHENITALVANALSILAFGDGTVSVDPEGLTDNARELIEKVIAREWKKNKKNGALCLGTGEIVSVPYATLVGGKAKIFVDTVSKERIIITEQKGEQITQCVVISDKKTIDKIDYFRLTSYSLEGNSYLISQKCVSESGVEYPLFKVDDWADITPEILIPNVERLPIGIFKCPANNRSSGKASVPITYGCDATIGKIVKTFKDIENEFEHKKVKLLADKTLFPKVSYDKSGTMVINDPIPDFVLTLGNSDKVSLDVFDPAFRESAYFAKLNMHFAFLEKEIGVSRGILTDAITQGATATEIKRANNATFNFTDDIRKNFVEYFDNLIYGVCVLLNFYGLTDVIVPEKVKLNYDWSYSLLEDSTETFNQKAQAVSLGAERLAELRMFIHPEETLEEAQAICAEIQAESEGSTEAILDAE